MTRAISDVRARRLPLVVLGVALLILGILGMHSLPHSAPLAPAGAAESSATAMTEHAAMSPAVTGQAATDHAALGHDVPGMVGTGASSEPGNVGHGAAGNGCPIAPGESGSVTCVSSAAVQSAISFVIEPVAANLLGASDRQTVGALTFNEVPRQHALSPQELSISRT